MTEANRPGYVFHCEWPGCKRMHLKLVPYLIRVGVWRHRWLCPMHRGEPDDA